MKRVRYFERVRDWSEPYLPIPYDAHWRETVDGAPTPLFKLRKFVDVLRRRLRGRGDRLSDVQRPLPDESVPRRIARQLPPAERAALLDQAAHSAGRVRPEFNLYSHHLTIPSDVMVQLCGELMKAQDHILRLVPLAGVHIKDERAFEAFETLVRDTGSHLSLATDILAIVVDESSRPHEYHRSLRIEQ